MGRREYLRGTHWTAVVHEKICSGKHILIGNACKLVLKKMHSVTLKNLKHNTYVVHIHIYSHVKFGLQTHLEKIIQKSQISLV